MVSFSCENCGDVVTKKKLDAHRGFCHGASFTCLDCMRHFRGTDYREHTSCISEAQKYEGKLYKDKSKRKTVSIMVPGEETPLQPYVEDVPEEPGSTVAIVEAMPQAPSPPPSAPPEPVNVFDFLVNDETPNASRISLGGSHEQMTMVDHAPPVFKSLSSSPDEDGGRHAFGSRGFSYGDAPISSTNYEDSFRTPASKPPRRAHHAHSGSTDKKRKRQVEDLDLTLASRSSQELDDEMLVDAEMGAPVLHSGLTGGLNRLLTSSEFPPSPDYSGGDNGEVPSPLSPAKRKRGTAGSLTGTATSATEKRGRRRHAHGAVLKVRKLRRSSDESRPRKHHRGVERGAMRVERVDSTPPKTGPQRAIEYHPERADGSPAGRADNAMVVYRSRAEHFLSFVCKGPESESGYSINKALKRYHRERGSSGAGREAKADAEKELWKSLRLKRNDRGEVVLFMGGGLG